MSAHIDSSPDWEALGAQWRAQPTVTLDTAAIRDEIARRDRKLQWALAGEVGAFLVAVGLIARVLLSPQGTGLTVWIMVFLGVMLAASQGWSLWVRRHQLRSAGLDVVSMIELDITRVRTSLRYWRVSVWITMLMWVVLAIFIVVMATSAAPSATSEMVSADKWVFAWQVGGLISAATAVWAWLASRLHRRRLAQLAELLRELREG